MLLRKVFFLLLGILSLHLFCSLAASAEPIPLFSEGEMQRLRYSQDEWLREVDQHHSILHSRRDAQPYSSRAINTPEAGDISGPIVSIIDPEAEEDIYHSSVPVRLLVYLKSRLAPINIETLNVKGKCGIFSLNITDRILPFMRQAQGSENADYVIDAKIPKLGAGHYLIILSLADIKGNQEEHKVFLEVSK